MSETSGAAAATAVENSTFAAAPADNSQPHRRFGLWEQHLTLDDGTYAIPTSRMCIDAAAEPRLTLVGAQMDRAQCGAYRFGRGARGDWSFYSVCRLDRGTRVTTSGTASGDFQSSYQIDVIGQTIGAVDAKLNAIHRLKIDARWLGSCPAGMAGGDYTSGGSIINAFRKSTR